MSEDFSGSAPSSPHSVMLKLVLLGEGGVGKSSLMTRYVNDEFDPKCAHTVGVEFLKKEVKEGKTTYILQIWDTAGQERFRDHPYRLYFRSLRTPFYRGSDICLLIYSVDNRRSFENLKLWLNEFMRHADVKNPREFPFVILGNKADLVPLEEGGTVKREVSKAEAEDWCCAAGPYPYLETSAKDSVNVQEAFEMAVRSWKNLKGPSERPSQAITGTNSLAASDSIKKTRIIEEPTTSTVRDFTNETPTIKLGKKQKAQAEKQLSVGGKSSGGCC